MRFALLIGTSAAVVALLATQQLSAAPPDTSFTFQGQLRQGGVAVNDTADFVFKLEDEGGAQIGSTFPVNALPVVDGLFTAELDFGNVFTGEALWLVVSVRSPAGSGPYTPLSPAQKLSAAPFAHFALDGMGGAGQWYAAGDNISNANAGFVGVNRTAPVNGAEYFGVQAPVSSGYGGMYIQTDGVDGWPFYGFRAGSQAAWTFMNGTTGDWHLYVDGYRMTVKEEGDVGIGTTSPLELLHVGEGDEAAIRIGSQPQLMLERDIANSKFKFQITGTGYPGKVLQIGRDDKGHAINMMGNVGIGTANPERVLHTVGDAILVERATNDAAVILRNTVNGTINAQFGLRSTGADDGYAYLTDQTITRTLYVRDGNVGIGDDTPSAKLSVSESDSNSTAVYGDNSGPSGNAGLFGCSNPANSETALIGIHGGAGKAFLAYNWGTGVAAEITVDNPASSASALRVTNAGNGPAVEAAGIIESTLGGFKFPDGSVQTTAATGGSGGLSLPYSGTVVSSSSAFSVTNDGNGRAAYFESTSDGEALRALSFTNDSAVTAINNGTGSAAFFQNFNGTANTVTVSSFADGRALNVLQLGDGGPAGHFEVNNSLSSQPAIRAVVTNGSGYAIDAQGTTRTEVLEITGGADLAEPFEVADEEAEAGMVLVINPQEPGRLMLSTEAYDRKAAGIVSGAGGVKPGMVMAQQGSVADGTHQVALTGRVYCWVDATSAAVQPGDLLTTSNTPGHAMKVMDHSLAQGAVIGKAMTSLESGKGLVLVLVSLQ